MRSWKKIVSILLFFVMAMGVTSSWAEDSRSLCIKEVNSERNSCVKSCQSTFRGAKDTCKGQDPICLKACFDAKHDCLEKVEQLGGECNDACETAFDAARDVCKASCQTANSNGSGGGGGDSGKGNKVFSACFLTCITKGVGDRASCKFGCKAQHKISDDVAAARKKCLDADQTCRDACKILPPVGTPTATPTVAATPTQ